MPENNFAVSAYIENESSILLVKHKKQQAWVPIGGKIEPNETPAIAVVREVREETGLIVGTDCEFIPTRSFELGLTDLTGMLAYHEYSSKPGGMHMCFSYILHSRHRNIVACDEYTETTWLNWPYFSAIASKKESVTFNGVPIPPNVVKLLYRCFSCLHGSGW